MNHFFVLLEFTKENIKIISSSFIISLFVGFFLYLVFDPIYKSESILYTQDKISISESAFTPNLGLPSLASGLTEFGVSKGKSERHKKKLLSRDFVISFINSNNLKPYIFASKKYDKKSEKFFFNENKYNPNTNKWEKTFFNKLALPPSDMLAYETFTREFYQVTETKEDFISIVIFHISPKVAKNILDLLISDFNKYVKEEEVSKANEVINFLSNYEVDSLNVEAIETINDLLASQHKLLATTLATEDIAFVPIDPPFEEVDKVGPSGILIMSLSVGSIMLLTYLILLLYRENKE
tara:strand:+ start:58 stop:945 length:888 start_codon:yes stop_codon:yes gene_type:complete